MQNISEGVSTAETVESTPGNATADASSVQDQNTVTKATPVTEDNSNTENVLAEETEKSNPTGAEGVDESQQQQTSASTEENSDATAQGDGASSSNLPSVTTEQEQDSLTDLSTLLGVAEKKSVEGIATEGNGGWGEGKPRSQKGLFGSDVFAPTRNTSKLDGGAAAQIPTRRSARLSLPAVQAPALERKRTEKGPRPTTPSVLLYKVFPVEAAWGQDSAEVRVDGVGAVAMAGAEEGLSRGQDSGMGS
ncbi:hypothetical protein Taro_027368 [Colocasia esculenta]|uniref:Uncharacterized protein n=1 Tax=Colocasia esculenta TaxID=4460 RepID=A0A843VFI6_COLES|nr:hypothetical protein [Colocasia esculenta]